MKLLCLIFTLLLSINVMADCCNSEVLESAGQCEVMSTDHDSDCHTSEATHGMDHCHCTPMNHLKIMPQQQLIIVLPRLTDGPQDFLYSDLALSSFQEAIFHPPIA